MSANELSIGITKLSGSNPLLKVITAILYDIITTKNVAKIFVIRSWLADLIRFSEVIFFCKIVESIE